MPNVHLAPAEIRAILDALTEISTRNPTADIAAAKLREALQLAQTKQRNKEIESRNAELYEAWNDTEHP